MAPVAEKAQQEPQEPWFFTSVTTPRVRQSTLTGSEPLTLLTLSSPSLANLPCVSTSRGSGVEPEAIMDTNSDSSKSLNWFRPMK